MATTEKGLSGPSECGGEEHDGGTELKRIMPYACTLRGPESPYAGHAGSRNARSGGKPIQGEKVVGRRRVEQAPKQRQSGQPLRSPARAGQGRSNLSDVLVARRREENSTDAWRTKGVKGWVLSHAPCSRRQPRYFFRASSAARQTPGCRGKSIRAFAV